MNRKIRRFKAAEPINTVPEYSLLIEKKKHKQIPKWLRNTIAILILIGTVLYLPPMLMNQEESKETIELPADVSMVLQAKEYLQDNPDLDFDGDGLINSKELEYGTDPYRVDTDGDGIMDYAELELTETNPSLYNEGTMMEIVKNQLDKAEKSVTSPFKINGVVMWPDNLEARTYGSVVRTLRGYRFCNYSGWVQFPENYAYKTDNGYHEELKYNKEGAVYIKGGVTTVEVFEKPLNMLYAFSYIGKTIYISNTFIGRLLCALLPEKESSLLSCKKVASIDIEPEIEPDVTAPIITTDFETDDSRFGRNHILLTDLARVRESIKENEAVLASLMSPIRGEAIVLIYGYTADGYLLAANPNTGEKLGKIVIQERASRLYDQSGEIVQYEWFIFKGLGFDSTEKDKISFFSAVIQDE